MAVSEKLIDHKQMDSKIKVLHIINGEHYSGAERVQDILASNLPQFGFDVTIACVKPGKFSSCCTCDTSKIVNFPMSSQFDLMTGIKVATYIKEQGIQLIHTHTPRTALIGFIASIFAKVPFVHHLHSPTKRDSNKNFQNRVNSFIEKWAVKKAVKTIAVSNSLAGYLNDEIHLNRNKIAVVLNGVPTGQLTKSSRNSENSFAIGVVALFRPRKGLEVLIDALSILVKKGCSFQLNAIGEFETESYKNDIHARISSKGLEQNVRWFGFVSNVYAALQQLDILVLPSLYGEGLPMVVLEAMANGVPVVASDVEGVSDAIIDERFGLLVKPGDPEALAENILKLIQNNNQRIEIAKNSYERQQSELSDISMVRQVADIYKSINYEY